MVKSGSDTAASPLACVVTSIASWYASRYGNARHSRASASENVAVATAAAAARMHTAAKEDVRLRHSRRQTALISGMDLTAAFALSSVASHLRPRRTATAFRAQS